MREIDISGRKHGKWTVIRKLPREKGKSGSTIWLCRCECGTELEYDSYHIRKTWRSLDCGCSRTLVGKKFNSLTVIERLIEKGRGAFEGDYICQCDCGRKKKYRGTQIISETVKTCGCGRNKGIRHNGISLVMNSYRVNAKKRKLVFELLREEVAIIIESPCVYCGKENTNKTQPYKCLRESDLYYHNGIDRVDNSKGYTKENCVPCCKLCNHMKWDLSIKEWKKHMELILKNLAKQSQPAMTG